MYKLIICVSLILLSINAIGQKEEITLFNSSGKAVAYIDTDDDDLTIYLWNGKPVAYLYKQNGDFHIYGFNGKHLGWFTSNIVRDHDGGAVGATKGATTVITEIEPLKSLKELKPLKSLRELAPLKPLFSTSWSSTNFKLFLLEGSDD